VIVAWKPEYAQARKEKAEADPEYKKKRNEQGCKDKEARKEYMADYYKANPEKFPGRTPEQQAAYNEARRKKYAENAVWRDGHKATVRAWAEANPEKRFAQRLRQYGITPEQYKQMMDAQGNACAICGYSDTTDPKMFPHVDHCHETNKVRGILCSHCNMAIGKFKNSEKLLLSAAEYVRKHG